MATNTDTKDTLAYYGYTFQVKVIAALFTDKQYLSNICDILDPTYFESEAAQWIVKTILTYYREYKQAASLEVMKVRMTELSDSPLKVLVKDTLKESYKYFESTDLKLIKDESSDFCRTQELKKGILESVDILKAGGTGRYDKIKTRIDSALKAGADTNVGHEYNNDTGYRFTDNVRNVQATPWDIINEICEGGFGKGELVVLAAGPGGGKSMGLVNIGGHAIKEGKTVLHYTLELNEAYVGRRYDSFFTGIPQQNLKYHQEEVTEIVKALPGKLIIKYYPTKSATVNTIAAHIEKCIAMGHKPDIVIIDYADLLRDSGGNRNSKSYEVMNGLYEDIRGMAGTYDVPIYTASQLNRSSAEMDVIGGDKIADSYAKLMVADFLVSLSRKMTDKIAGTGRWHVIKNRFGPDGLTFPSKLNMATCKIEIFEESTVQGKAAKKDMDNGTGMMKKMLKKKFEELQKDDLG